MPNPNPEYRDTGSLSLGRRLDRIETNLEALSKEVNKMKLETVGEKVKLSLLVGGASAVLSAILAYALNALLA